MLEGLRNIALNSESLVLHRFDQNRLVLHYWLKRPGALEYLMAEGSINHAYWFVHHFELHGVFFGEFVLEGVERVDELVELEKQFLSEGFLVFGNDVEIELL